ncbi:MAG: hypothetical protein ACRC62_39505, partial [Microcoleus sp.]
MSISSLPKALRALAKAKQVFVQSRNPYPLSLRNGRVHRWFKWLAPGLLVKRWLLISAGGVMLASLGLAIWTGMTPIFFLIQSLRNFLSWLAAVVPNYISGPIVIASGLLLILWGQTRSLNSITSVLMPEGNEELIDRLLNHRR